MEILFVVSSHVLVLTCCSLPTCISGLLSALSARTHGKSAFVCVYVLKSFCGMHMPGRERAKTPMIVTVLPLCVDCSWIFTNTQSRSYLQILVLGTSCTGTFALGEKEINHRSSSFFRRRQQRHRPLLLLRRRRQR